MYVLSKCAERQGENLVNKAAYMFHLEHLNREVCYFFSLCLSDNTYKGSWFLADKAPAMFFCGVGFWILFGGRGGGGGCCWLGFL